MRWQLGRRSQNVEDQRGMGAPAGMGGAGGIGIPGGLGRSRGGMARGGGIGGIGLLILLLLGWWLGIDPSYLLQDFSGDATYQAAPSGTRPPADDQRAAFVSAVLGDTEDTWHALFKQMGGSYREPKLVLFSGAVRSACGFAQAAMGPFYCPGDEKVYLDLSFFDELHDKFGAPGDFAQAYVIAHEVGHHVQKLLGIADQVQAARQQVGERGSNALSVMMELQADCFAGVWGYHADKNRHLLEQGDIEEGLNAAAAIGDDRLQRQAQGYVVPDAFTHGSSAQRVRWFRQGLSSGDPKTCNTFAAAGR
jgi:predicted metalloprotease